tara:strand:- start:220 stop:798 length:579 start_codon:yes stop_codon:yes gene_type:complete
MGLALASMVSSMDWGSWGSSDATTAECGVLMVGLDAAGKTTILYKLKLGEVVETIPTIGFNVESVTFKNVKFNVWDVGGQGKIRALWRHYYVGVQGIIFVVDSSDADRIEEAKRELHGLLEAEELRDVCVLVFMNKQDLGGALTPTQIVEQMDLRSISSKWYGQGCCARSGDGLNEGLDWLSTTLKEKSSKS